MSTLPTGGRIAARIAFGLILAATAWFFATELKANWSSVRDMGQRFNMTGMLAALGMVIASCLVVALAWHTGITASPLGAGTGLGTSMAVVNITQLTKYLPGKVWSSMLQMFLMEGRGVPKSYVLYVSLLVTLSMLSTATILGLLYLVCYPHLVPRFISLPLFCSVISAYLGLIFLNGKVMRGVVSLIDRIFKTNTEFFELPLSVLLRMQVPLIIGNALFGLAACAVCYSIGGAMTMELVFPVSAVALLSDALGFVMVFVPGGLGVREGAMFILLNKITDKNISLLLPLAMRTVTLASDLLLGATALIMFRKHVWLKK